MVHAIEEFLQVHVHHHTQPLLHVLPGRSQAKLAVAGEAVQRYKQRIRQMTLRQTGRSMSQIAQDLQVFLPGWKAYFQLAQTPKVWRRLDEWLRHRLRAIQLKF